MPKEQQKNHTTAQGVVSLLSKVGSLEFALERDGSANLLDFRIVGQFSFPDGDPIQEEVRDLLEVFNLSRRAK